MPFSRLRFPRTLRFAGGLLALCALLLLSVSGAQAETVTTISDQGSAARNGHLLASLIENDEAKTITITGDFPIDRVMRPGDNTTIIATGATITQTKKNAGMLLNVPDALDYRSLRNVRIVGGTWKTTATEGYTKSMFRFAHASDIALDGLTVPCNYVGHAIELIACRNVTVEHCTLHALGSCPSTCLEEQVQIDLATPSTAPNILADSGSAYVAGQTCRDIFIIGNSITGARAVCANYTRTSNNRYLNKFHRTIVIKNNTLVGKTSEALMLANVIGATVTGNRITSYGKRLTKTYSIGCNIALFGKPPASMRTAKILVSKNTVKGGRQAIQVYSYSHRRFGKVAITHNTCYCKRGRHNAIKAPRTAARKMYVKRNRLRKW